MKLMKDMTEVELKNYFNGLMDDISLSSPPDVTGFLIIQVVDHKISQYASSIHRQDAIGMLRELADRLERRDTIER